MNSWKCVAAVVPAGFRSEAEVITENDAKSISYDDVGEAAESQPLTSPAVPAGTSGDSFFGDDALNQHSGKFWTSLITS